MAIVGWIAAAILAFSLREVETAVSEIPVVGEFLADSCELSLSGLCNCICHRADRGVAVHPAFFVAGTAIVSGVSDQRVGFLFGGPRILLSAIAFFVYKHPDQPPVLYHGMMKPLASSVRRFTGQSRPKPEASTGLDQPTR